jgi:hypothetical protein
VVVVVAVVVVAVAFAVGFAAWGIIKCFRHRRGILFTVSILTRCNSVSSPHSTSRSGSRSGRRLQSRMAVVQYWRSISQHRSALSRKELAYRFSGIYATDAYRHEVI